MKRKSIFITGLMVLMALLVFVGCEPSVVGPTKFVSSADIIQNGVFLEGQPYDASKFSVVVKYTDNTSETLDGVNVYRAATEAEEGVVNGEKLSAVAGVNLQGQTVVANGALVAYKIDSLTVTAPASVVSSSRSTINVADTSGFSAVANYRDSQGAAQTFPLVNGADFNVTFGSATYENNEATTGTVGYTVNLKFGSYSGLVGSTGTVNVTRPPVTAEDYSDYEWTGKVVYAQVPASSTVKYFNNGVFDGDKMVEVYKVFTPEAETTSYSAYYLEKVEDGLEFALTTPLEGEGNENRFATTGDTAAFTMTYTYIKDEDAAYGYKTTLNSTNIVIGSIDGVEENADGKLVSTNEGTTWYTAAASGAMSITGIKADYITALKAERKVDMPFIVGADPQPADFTVTATYASGYVNEDKNVLESSAYTVETKDVTTSTTSVNIKLVDVESPYSDAATTTTAAIRVVVDYPSSVSVKTIPSDVKTNTAYSSAKWEYNVTWTSGKSYNTEDEGNTAADMPTISYSYNPGAAGEAGEAEDVEITWTCNTVTGKIKTSVTPIA